MGNECRCPLCVLDDATAFLKRVRSAFERGMMTRELAEYLIESEEDH